MGGGGGGKEEGKEGEKEEVREGFAFPPAANRWIIFEDELSNVTLLEKANTAWEVFEVFPALFFLLVFFLL